MKKRLKLYIPALLASVMVALLVSLALWAPAGSFVLFYVESMTDPRYMQVAVVVPLVVIFVIMFDGWMQKLGWRWLNWSPFAHGVVAMPIAYRYLRIPFVLLLAFCIPILAWLEEIFFRFPVSGWIAGLLWGGLFFGALHVLGLVPLRMVIYLSLLGVVLVEVYLTHGLVAAFVFHATYNYMVLTFILLTIQFGVNDEKPLLARLKNGLARRG